MRPGPRFVPESGQAPLPCLLTTNANLGRIKRHDFGIPPCIGNA
jgi:hypothetical protein